MKEFRRFPEEIIERQNRKILKKLRMTKREFEEFI